MSIRLFRGTLAKASPLRCLALVLFLACQPAAAGTIKEEAVGDHPAIASILEIREPLYPSGNVRSADGLDVDSAYYSDPTDRYGHNVFAGSHEYATLSVTANGQTSRVELTADVFEDITPRIADLDRDGLAEIIVIRSSAQAGARLEIYRLRSGALTLLAHSPPIGTRNRWMNVAGIGDFNGDGIPEIALVDRPHIRGELEFWNYDGRPVMARRAAALGFSNHAIGSDALDLSAVVISSGKTLLLLPSTDRQALKLVDATGNQIKVLDRFNFPGQIVENLAIERRDDKTLIGVRLEDGSIRVVSIAR